MMFRYVCLKAMSIAAFLLLFFSCSVDQGLKQDQNLKLWYNQPAGKDWMKALPVGNGRLGGMIFGGISEERIMLNESSLWNGWFEPENDRKGAFDALEKVRALLKQGKRDEVQDIIVNKVLTDKGYGKPDFGCYQSFCDVLIKFDRPDKEVKNYRRELNLATGIATVEYEIGDTKFKREYFCSYPDQVVVMKLSTNKESSLGGTIGINSLHKNSKVKVVDNKIFFSGEVDTGNKEHEGLKFEAQLVVLADGGSMQSKDSKIQVEKANSVTIVVAGATNYQMSYPNYYGELPSSRNKKTLQKVKGKSFNELHNNHLADFESLFSRVDLQLESDTSYLNLPTDERLKLYRKNKDDRQLEILLFQYGRYLLISSSRPGGLPANLQGLWNNSNTPPWKCDYHLNINLQMNYWPAEVCNLAECHLPLINWIGDLRKAGEKTAKIHFNSKGWVASHTCNVWGFTAPGSQRGVHMFEPQSAAWIALHAYEHYAFSHNTDFLKQNAWPILKGAAEFWLCNLQEYPDGILVSSPCFSPEHGPITDGAYFDQEVIWELFTSCIKVGGLLENEGEFVEQVKAARSRLWPLKIGKFGQLCEWMDNEVLEEGDSTIYTYFPKNHHRHISHLMGLYPGSQITVEKTPELARAACVSLNQRGDGGTGWSKAWKINCWARLKDGNRAWKLCSEHLANNMFDNLFDACPPFQIDGNFGYTSGVAEMLIQSHNSEIELLPALPDVWGKGKVKGFCARGGFTFDMEWSKEELISVKITSTGGTCCRVRYKDNVIDVNMEQGNTKQLAERLNSIPN